MQYDFDTEISRAGTSSTKWEFLVRDGKVTPWDRTDPKHGDDRVLPMWVADMDFAVAKPIHDAIVKRAAHPIFGYSRHTQAYTDAVVGWMRRRHGWTVKPEWMLITPGVVPALNIAVRAFTDPGDKVLIQRPVYHPFTFAAERNGRQVVSNSLVYEGGRYRMDFDDLERKAADPAVKIALLCSPHNPVGRVWTAEELARFGEICMKHGVVVVADEIHADLMLNGAKFAPYGLLGERFLENTIVCTAPSKTFSLAGLHTSNLFVVNPELRAKVAHHIMAAGLNSVDPFALVATEAAYNHGEEWLTQALAYIEGNLDYLERTVAARIPNVKVIRPEGTYLVWLDFRALGLDKDRLADLMLNEAKLFFDEGKIFGPEGEGFERINIACPRSIVEECCRRLERVSNAAR